MRIRASSWGELFDCAHRWEGKYLLGITGPATGAAHLGTSIHRGTAAYDAAKLDEHPISIANAVDCFVDTLHNPTQDIRRVENDLTPRDAEMIGMNLVTRYCMDVSPLYKFKAVEMTIKPFTITVGSQSIELSGTMDRARVSETNNGVGISDVKTGKRAVERGCAKVAGHHLQLGIYELLAEHSLGLKITAPAEIIGLQTSQNPKIGISQVPDATAGLIGTAQEPGLIEMAAGMLQSGLFPPNPSSMLCHPTYCPRWSVCLYRSRKRVET